MPTSLSDCTGYLIRSRVNLVDLTNDTIVDVIITCAHDVVAAAGSGN